jgi:hypothetical protein
VAPWHLRFSIISLLFKPEVWDRMNVVKIYD